jgi:hypothetical protein
MLLTVEAPDLGSAMSLVQRLVRVVGGEAVSLDASGREVRVEAVDVPDDTLVEALDAVEAWLADLQLDHARVSCDGHEYTMERSTRRRSMASLDR